MNRCAVCICESGRFASCDPVPTACGARWVRWIRVGKFENIPKTGIPIKALVKGHKALGLRWARIGD